MASDTCIYCHSPRFSDEAVAARRGETLADWLAFKASQPTPPEAIRPGAHVTLRSDLRRPARIFQIACIHGPDMWIDGHGAVSWSAVHTVVTGPIQLDLFEGAA